MEEDMLPCVFGGCSQMVRIAEYEDHLLAHQLEEVECGIHPLQDQLTLGSSTDRDVDNLSTCTKGVIASLERYYTSPPPPRGVTSISLSGDTWHLCSAPGDVGWGCGYRNTQMVFSSLLQLEPYRSLLKQKGVSEILSISKLQEMIEDGWSKGFDPKGHEDLGGKVHGTRKWIGTTEVASVFRNLNLRALVMDFVNPTGPNGTHPKLFQWVRDYFRGKIQIAHLKQIAQEPEVHEQELMTADTPESSGSVSAANGPSPEELDYPPLYFQHEGHSRTIIGVEERGKEVFLLVLDPLHSPQQMGAVLSDPANCTRLLRKSIHQIKEKEYEIVFIDGTLSEEERLGMKVITPYRRIT